MAKPWLIEEDIFLLRYRNIGLDFVASHDLGRPQGAGSRRFKKISEDGSAVLIAQMQIARSNVIAMRSRSEFDIDRANDEVEYWETLLSELQECLSS